MTSVLWEEIFLITPIGTVFPLFHHETTKHTLTHVTIKLNLETVNPNDVL